MATYTITIRTFLLSHMTNEFGEPNGQGVDPDGDFYHMNEVIDKTYNKVFDKMNLYVDADEIFQKEFCKRFYNREIGRPTWAQFNGVLESLLNTTCYHMFKFREAIRNMTEEDWAKTTNMTSESSGDSKGLGIVSTQPQKDLSIIYPGSNGAVIKYADALNENYGNQKAMTKTSGSNTLPLFQLLNYQARITAIDEMIFTVLDNEAFYQIFGG